MGKVDTTVLLAQGIGERLKPLTFDTPKPLLRVKGEVLIERLIKQLKDKNINNIFIVVGYLNEKFNYLEEKYGVKLIYNDDFLTKGTLSAFSKVYSCVFDKNFYILNADIYLTDNIFKDFENETNFKVFYFDKNSNNYILNNSQSHIEIAYFDKNNGNKLLKYCQEFANQEENKKLSWEDILNKNEFVNVDKIGVNIAFVFDSIDDIKNFDNDIDTGCKSMQYIKKIFNVAEKDIVIDKIATAGLTNYSFVFNILNDNKKYLMRVPGNGTDSLIDRKLEARVLKEMAKYDITEKVVFVDSDTGYKISEYIEDGRVIDTENEDDLRFAMKKLKELHSINIDIKDSKNLFDWVLMYENAIKKHNLVFTFNDHDIIKKKIDDLSDSIKKMNRKMSFCHGDANPSNMLITNNDIKFIDFEYVNIFDQAFEIAMFALNAGYKYDKIPILIEYYIEQEPKNDLFNGMTKEEAEILVIKYFAISQYYCYLWGIVFQYIKSIDYTDYIISCHEKMLEAIKYLEGDKNA